MSHLAALALVLAAKKSSSGSSTGFLLILILGFGAVWYFFLRPQQAKARKAREQTKAFEVGDEVVTVGGIVGRVLDVEGDRVTILSGEAGADGAPPTRLVLVRQAIAKKADPVVAGSSEGDDLDEDESHESHDAHDAHDAHDEHDEDGSQDGSRDSDDDPPEDGGNGRRGRSPRRGGKGDGQ